MLTRTRMGMPLRAAMQIGHAYESVTMAANPVSDLDLRTKKEPRLITAVLYSNARPANTDQHAAGSLLKKCRGLKKEGGNLLRGVPPTKKAPTLVQRRSPHR